MSSWCSLYSWLWGFYIEPLYNVFLFNERFSVLAAVGSRFCCGLASSGRFVQYVHDALFTWRQCFLSFHFMIGNFKPGDSNAIIRHLDQRFRTEVALEGWHLLRNWVVCVRFSAQNLDNPVKGFCSFPSRCREILEWYLKICHYRSLPNHSQFIVNCY
jgi:hypothetical protein